MVDFIDIDENKKDDYNNIVNHPLQSYEWGEFRKKTGAGIIRQAKLSGKKIDEAFCLTLHKTPFLKSFIGYLPKGNLPTNELLTHLLEIGRENKCIFIQLEPNTTEIENLKLKIENLGLVPSAHPLFTKFSGSSSANTLQHRPHFLHSPCRTYVASFLFGISYKYSNR